VRGLDTNVLVRFLTRDDPEQSRIVRSLFERADAEKTRFHVSSIALCELVWVLRSKYRLQREEICSALEHLLAVGLLEIQHRDLAILALADFRRGKADFPDYFIGWQNRRAGCEDTLSFDRDLDGTPGFTLLG
jgi:predicted nucleic-acid-binding protein